MIIEKLEKLYEQTAKKAHDQLGDGGEFANHRLVAKKTGVETYFCDPYASWQKGGVENSNGRLRRDLPRTTDIWQLDQEDFDEIIDNQNARPNQNPLFSGHP